jgi:hypothetical protein
MSCKLCQDKGFVLANVNMTEAFEIQRCDLCRKFEDDNEAQEEAYRLACLAIQDRS